LSPSVLVVLAALGYLALGVIFAVPFVLVGAGRLDPVAARAPARVRLLFLPGAAALWPILLNRWVRACGRGDSADERAGPGKATDGA